MKRSLFLGVIVLAVGLAFPAGAKACGGVSAFAVQSSSFGLVQQTNAFFAPQVVSPFIVSPFVGGGTAIANVNVAGRGRRGGAIQAQAISGGGGNAITNVNIQKRGLFGR